MSRPFTPLTERFWAKVNKTDSCWLWTASPRRDGYGEIGVGGRGRGMVLAHRLSWEIRHGEIPDDLCVLHRCDVRACVNPEHLFLGTRPDNTRDMLSKGRQSAGVCHQAIMKRVARRGDLHPYARVTSEKVRVIRFLAASTSLRQIDIAMLFDVNKNVIADIVRQATWAHVNEPVLNTEAA